MGTFSLISPVTKVSHPRDLASPTALAAEPLLLDTTRNGNRYYLTGYEQSEGRIKVVLRCVFSDEEWIKTVAQLAQQGVPAGDARKMVCNEYSLRYSADGTRYQRLYDRYLDAEGFKILKVLDGG